VSNLKGAAISKGEVLGEKKHGGIHLRGNLIAGVLTIIPILVVFVVLAFVLEVLFRVGTPLERALTDAITRALPAAEPILTNPLFEWFVAIVVALLLIYTIGATASHVLGNRLLLIFERLIDQIPIVQTVYSASKKLLGLLQHPPASGAARVVLFDFPYPGVKVIGVVMRTFTDSNTGEEIAIVYVPTTPNPTSGYLEMAPVKNLVQTNMTMEDAITMIVSGGAITPDDFSLSPGPNGPTAVKNPISPDPTGPIAPED
jgi:uncharacterized membrane protein